MFINVSKCFEEMFDQRFWLELRNKAKENDLVWTYLKNNFGVSKKFREEPIFEWAYWWSTSWRNFSSVWYLFPPGTNQSLRDTILNLHFTSFSEYGHMLDQPLNINNVEYCVLWTYWCIFSVSPDTKFDQTLLDANAFRLS